MDHNIRVMVVDDTVTYRKIVTDVLTSMPGIEVVGTAPNGKIALAKIEQLRPDVLTLDLEMPEMDGLDVLRHLKQSDRQVGAIVLSGASKHGANATLAALDLGAFDFVPKPAGGNAEENTKILARDLRPRIEAFARKMRVADLLHGSIAKAQSDANDVAQRMQRITNGGPTEVVAVGISTGGPQALNQMLPKLPADLSAPVLIVQHMPPVFTKSLADHLNKLCALTVSEAVDGQPVVPGHILIAPGGKHMKVVRDTMATTVQLTHDPHENSCRPSVDYLFRSVARVYGASAVGVIMTGMGNDGALGCRQMKQRGAAIIAQDEASCVVFGMPREPIDEGIVDVVAPLDEIAEQVDRLVRRGVVSCR